MRSLVVYSSLTGNTKMLAEAVFEALPDAKDICNVKNNPDFAAYDLICLGYWVDKGGPNAAMLAYMEKVRGKKVFLFGTLGAYPDSDHAKDCMAKAAAQVAGNEVVGNVIRQGKIDPQLLERMARMQSAHTMTEERRARIEEAKKHPNAQDLRDVKTALLAAISHN